MFEKQEKLETIHVKHLIDIQGVRFLYTKKVLEMIHHHFVKGFDYRQFRHKNKNDLDDLNDRNMFLDYDNTIAGRRKPTKDSQDHSSKTFLNKQSLKKEALVALRLEQA